MEKTSRDNKPDQYSLLYSIVYALIIGLAGVIVLLSQLMVYLGLFQEPVGIASGLLIIISAVVGIGICLFILLRQDDTIQNIKWPKTARERKNLFLYFTVLIFVWFPVLGGTFGVFFGAPAWWIMEISFDIGTGKGNYFYAVILLIISLPCCLAGLSSFSRLSWMIGTKRNIRNIASSKIRSAALGLVEFQGKVVRAVPDTYGGENIFGHENAVNFFIEDDTGRILVKPPETLLAYDARYSLPIHRESLFPVLNEGDEVYALGRLVKLSGSEELCIIPWKTPYGRFYGRCIGLLGRWKHLLSFFDTPDLFMVGLGREDVVKARIFRAQRIWLGFSFLVLIGASTLMLIALQSLM